MYRYCLIFHLMANLVGNKKYIHNTQHSLYFSLKKIVNLIKIILQLRNTIEIG